MRTWPYYLILVFICFSCKESKEIKAVAEAKEITLSYAKSFAINQRDGYIELEVNKPWPNAENGFRYALVPREQLAAYRDSLRGYDAVIGVPVKKVIVTSTTHIPALEILEEEKSLIGFPSLDFVSSPKTRALINSGAIKELGNNEALNLELALALEPELIVTFGIDNKVTTLEPLERAGIPIVYNADWTEESPLGRAEWIKFMGVFYDKLDEATAFFDSISKDYQQAKQRLGRPKTRPKIMTGAVYKDVWYVSGGKSWAAQFIKDAQAEYLWESDTATGSIPVALENMLVRSHEADIWLSPGLYTTYADLKAANPHYDRFRAFKENKIFSAASLQGETGGMLYFELAPQRPDLVLQDLIYYLHPGVLTDYIPYFYKPLE
ncbi:ABC transporter substrate-binding protein [Sediminicola luteus]|uniref:Fe/B12 periplasmic-binding domain-containing protein n=1 Tax=Sediminicola luteus TaxID=319238 RepID=A0A2A4G395_9FLAO|nr:ABC transporter substrate-binding protein [Sediminicola luteus]PCE62440.1 hypothetical protein B7P33_18985 [Sediminicola luteus]